MVLFADSHAQTEVWYNWQGQKVGELPVEASGKTQPKDLVVNDQTLVRMPVEPWNLNRRYRRISDWYRDRYDSYDYGWGNWGYPYRCHTPMPRQRVHLWYGSGGNWGIHYQSPGLLLRWHH